MNPKRVLLALSLYLPFSGAFATDYYVDQRNARASDTNPGTEAQPWRTLYRAAREALQPGDTVFVKAGIYDASQGGNWDRPVINPASSGEPGRPISFKALPMHSVILDTHGRNPAIGSRSRDYIVIDGFVIQNPGPKGIVVFGDEERRVRGVVVQNNVVSGVRVNHPTDNSDGIRVENATRTVVRNNILSDVRNGSMTWNAAGVKLYRTDATVVENNEIYGVGAGIFDKQGGVDNEFRRNYIHDCDVVGILSYTKSGFPARNISIYENVIDKCAKAVMVQQSDDDAALDNVSVYNNVFANYREAGMSPARDHGRAALWNNIFFRSSAPSAADFITFNDPPATLSLMDYNLFVTEPSFILGRYRTNRAFSSLSAWSRATAFDRHSLVAAISFANPNRGDFRLREGSIAAGAGRRGGITSGAPVNIGAYPTGLERIGVSLGDAPAAPSLIEVE